MLLPILFLVDFIVNCSSFLIPTNSIHNNLRTIGGIAAINTWNAAAKDQDEFFSLDHDDSSSSEPYYPPLTGHELESRKSEILLIAKLNHGDTPTIADFKKHWFSERGSNFEALLTHADHNIGRGMEHWEEAQGIFEDLIRQDPTFLEPKARYAKLLCLQGNFDESCKWAQQVLDSKPWHFVTLETMVANHTGKGNTIMTELWMARRLPTMKRKDERRLWVDRALEDAGVILTRMEALKGQGK